MPNIVIMVHKPFSEIVLKGAFSENILNTIFQRSPDLKVFIVPSDLSERSLDFPLTYLNNILHTNGIDDSDIHFVIVESNYGKPSLAITNTDLLSHLLQKFPKARIVGYGNTIESLVGSLHYHEKITVLSNKSHFEKDIALAFPQLSPQAVQALCERVLSIRKLQEEIMKLHDKIKPQAIIPPAIINEDVVLPRPNPSSFLPQYTAARATPPLTDETSGKTEGLTTDNSSCAPN